MKNIVITVVLFGSIIFACFISVNYLNKVCHNMYVSNSSIQTYIYKGNWNEANKISENLSKDWHIYSNNCSVFVNHTLIDDISVEEHKLQEYIRNKNKDEALASVSSIEFLIERIRKLETINIQNVF